MISKILNFFAKKHPTLKQKLILVAVSSSTFRSKF